MLVDGDSKGPGSGYTKSETLSPELSALVGQNAVARHEVVKKICDIIKECDLYDPNEKQFATCDDALFKVIGVKRFRTFRMMHLKRHFIAKKVSDSETTERSDKDETEIEYSSKIFKSSNVRKLKKGYDSDSDEDWTKTKKGGGYAKLSGSGYTKSVALSPELSALVGQNAMARHEVVKKIWDIIKERDLYDPNDKHFAICDDALFKVIGVKRFRTFGMMKYLKCHFIS